MPARIDDLKKNGWIYSYGDNPENKEIKGEGYETSTMENGNGKITITVVNNSGDIQLFSNCDVGGIDYSVSGKNNCSLVVAKKLRISSKTSNKEIKEAWGEPTSELNGQYGTTLRYEKGAYVFYQFSFDNEGNLTEFEARNWESGSNNVNSQDYHPEYLDKYETPKQLSDDIFSYVFKLQGELYQLPAPVNEFTNNGWTVVSQVDHVAVGQEAISGLRMSKKGVELSFNIKNFSNKQTTPSETMVTNVYVNNTFYPDVDFELSGGIKFGMTENDFINVVDISKFEKSSFSGKTEYDFTTFSNHFYFTFDSNGKLVEVNLGKNISE